MTGQGLHFSLSSPCRRRVGPGLNLPTHMLLLGDRSGSGPLAAGALTTAAQRFSPHLARGRLCRRGREGGPGNRAASRLVGGRGGGGQVLAAFLTQPATDGHARFSGAEPKEKLVDPVLGRPLEEQGPGRKKETDRRGLSGGISVSALGSS